MSRRACDSFGADVTADAQCQADLAFAQGVRSISSGEISGREYTSDDSRCESEFALAQGASCIGQREQSRGRHGHLL
jgi:hypothetical protein